jgi:hypothetical protein
MKILSGILILITAFLSLKHGWDGLQVESHPEQAKMAAELGIGKSAIVIMSAVSLVVGIAALFPQTYFFACFINALSIVSIMAFSLRSGNYKIALIEIPFLLLPLLIIYLGHPFKK